MELRHIRYFLTVAEERNFTRAAARIGIGQPPLSQQIKDLEREIGAPLFHRVPQGAELTEAGRAFLEQVQGFPAQAERAVKAAQRAGRGETGSLRVGFTGSAAFNPVVASAIRSFRRAYPDVELSLDEANTTRLVGHLIDGVLDAVFMRPGSAGSDAVQYRLLSEEPMMLVLPAGHPEAGSDPVELSRLKDDAFILFPRVIGQMLYDIIVGACRDAGFEPKLGQSAPQIGFVVNLVAAELGVSIVPLSMSQLQVTGVVYRRIAGTPPIARLALAYRRGNTSVILRNFIARA
jgi:DNA-binding transcriptional LysR family regulator